MRNLKKIFLGLLMAGLPGMSVMAQKNVFVEKGLKYEVIGEGQVKVMKVSDDKKPKGRLNIPSTVKHDGKTYTVTTIDSWGFFGCRDITDIVIPETVTKVDIWAFTSCEKIKTIKFPNTVKQIGYAVLESCTNLQQVQLPAGLTEINDRLFQECTSLQSITLPAGITAIKESAFSKCTSLKSIKLPPKVATIGNWAFHDCESLENIELPSSLQSIGANAFSSCSSLKSINLPEGLLSLSTNAFEHCNALESIVLPASLTHIQGNPFTSCKALKEIKVAPGSQHFTTKDGVLFTKDMTQLVACPLNLDLGDYVVPATVTVIAPYAFFYCNHIKSLKMTGVERIGESAIYYCPIESVDLGTKLKVLENGAFYNCSKLTQVYLPSSVEMIGRNNFDFCNLKLVSLSEQLSKNENAFNNFSFDYNDSGLKFEIRLENGGTKTLTYDQIPDMKSKLFYEPF